MKELIAKIAVKTGESPEHIKVVVEAVALELSTPEALTAFIQASKPIHRAHLESEAAKTAEAQPETKPAKKTKKGT